MKEPEMQEIGELINLALTNRKDASLLKKGSERVTKLIKKFPLYPEIGV